MSTPGQPGEAHSASPVGDNLQLMECYTFVWQNPNWIMNILLGMVCQMIPLIGPLVYMGYEFELIEALHRDPRRVYPDFDFGRFTIYLSRGLWPFLLVFYAMLIFMVVIAVITVVPYIAAIAIGGEESALVVLAWLFGMAVFFVAIVVVAVVSMPMALRSGLTQSFRAGLDLAFIKDFLRRMWVDQLLSIGFLVLSNLIAVGAGCLTCGIGIYPAMVLISLAQFHALYQLYEIYLHRGGMRIPLKDPE